MTFKWPGQCMMWGGVTSFIKQMQHFINIDSHILAALANEHISFPSYHQPVMCLIYFLWLFPSAFSCIYIILPPFIFSLFWLVFLILCNNTSNTDAGYWETQARVARDQKQKKKKRQLHPPEIMKMFNMCLPWALFSVFPICCFSCNICNILLSK